MYAKMCIRSPLYFAENGFQNRSCNTEVFLRLVYHHELLWCKSYPINDSRKSSSLFRHCPVVKNSVLKIYTKLPSSNTSTKFLPLRIRVDPPMIETVLIHSLPKFCTYIFVSLFSEGFRTPFPTVFSPFLQIQFFNKFILNFDYFIKI